MYKVIPNHIIDDARSGGSWVITEYHVSSDICILLKSRDMIFIKKNEPHKGEKKKVVSWRKKTNSELNDILDNLKWGSE